MSFLLKGKGREPAQLTYRSPTPPPPLLDGIQMDEPYVSYHAVHTAFPDAHHSDVDIQHFDFPYGVPEDAEYDSASDANSSGTAQDPELASSVSYLPEAQILARILGDGRTLELRWLGYVNKSSRKIKSDNETLIRISFPRTLRNISASKCLYVNPSTGALTVVVLDRQNGIYRLQFDAPLRQLEKGYMFPLDRHTMFRSTIDASYGMPTRRHRDGPEQQVIWSVYSDEGVAIGLEGCLLRCLWHGQDWSFFPIANAAKPRTGRGWPFNSEPQHPYASQTIALTTYKPQHTANASTFAYTMSRDRTLRSFNLTDLCPVGKVVDVHHGIEGLTRDAVERSSQLQTETEHVASEESIPQVPLLQVLPASDNDWHFIFVLSPTPKGVQGGAILRTYTARIKKNDIADLSAVGYISCSEETLEADFRGFSVEATPGLSTLAASSTSHPESPSQLDDAVWKVWTAWDLGGQALVEWSSLTTMLRPGNVEEDTMVVSTSVVAGRPVTNPWKKVHDLSAILEPEVVFDSTYIDELIDATDYDPDVPSADIKEHMLPLIFYPGRFSQHTLNVTLTDYHANLPKDLQEAQYLQDPDVSIDVKVGEIIGCNVRLEEDEETGLPKFEEFREDFKREYLGFWAGLQAQERQSRWPLLLAPSNGNILCSGVIVIGREGVIAPTIDDEISLMVWLLDKAETDDTQQTAAEKATLLTMGRDALLPFLSGISEPTRRREMSMALSAASVVARSMTTQSRNEQQAKILDSLASHLAGYSVDEAIEAILAEHGFDSESMLELGPGIAAAFEDGYPARQAIESCLDILSRHLPIYTKEHLTFYGSSTAVAAATQSLNLRSKVLFELLLVILVLRSGAADAVEDGDAQEAEEEWFNLIARATVILQRTLVGHWLTKWRSDGTGKLQGKASDPKEREMFRKLFVPTAEQTDNLDPQTYYSMFHALIMGLDVAIDTNSKQGNVSINSLSDAGLRTTPIAKFGDTVDASARDVVLANRLFNMGLTAYASAMTAFWPSQNGMAYVRAKAMVLSGEAEEAAKIFLSLANTIAEPDWAQTDETGLVDVLPGPIRYGGLPAFYHHVMDVFEAYGFVQQSTVFAELAIRALPSTYPTAEDLHKKVFRAYIAMDKYEEAYAAMIANPFADFATDSVGKERPLGDLIHAMCHNNQIQALLSLPFIGLENQVEQELTFRARNSDPVSTPNYYQILFAWHIMKTDYRQAGVTMYLQGRRIAEHLNSIRNRRHGESSRSGEDYGNYLAKQAQCYLAVIQAFSLTNSKNSWFTLPAMQSAPFLHEQKRRKVSSLIPSTEFSSRVRDLQIVKLEDVKKEYSAVVALLTVIRRTGGELDPNAPLSLEDCIRYLCRDGLYDEAFLSAASYGCDMTEIFASLTERCLLLSPQYGDQLDPTAFAWLDTSPISSTWTGTLAERSWRYLQQMLQTHRPSTLPAGQYYQAVIQTALELNRHFPLPIWLLEWAVTDQSGGFETLIREALKWGLVAESVEWCRAYVMRSFADMPVTLSNGAVRPVYTPYTTFDQVAVAVKAMAEGTDDEKRLKRSAEKSVDAFKAELDRRAASLEGR